MQHRFPFVRAAACLLLAASAFHAQAQTRHAADPQAAVPATRYQSALGTRLEAPPSATPDQNWVAGNETVAAINSMALTMKPMAGHAGHGGHATAQAPAPQAVDPHAGHSMPAAQPTNSHAGHSMQATPSTDPHAGHAGHAGMHGMAMGKQDSPDMCTPGAKDGASGGGKMACCQPTCCCKDKMGKADKAKEAT